MTATHECLFVYGTLMRRAKHPMHAHLARHAQFVGEACFNGRMYELGGYPGAVASADPNDKIFGELYRLKNPDAVFRALDEYEGCGPNDPQPTEYVRRKTVVCRQDGEAVESWIYLYNRPSQNLRRITSARFREN